MRSLALRCSSSEPPRVHNSPQPSSTTLGRSLVLISLRAVPNDTVVERAGVISPAALLRIAELIAKDRSVLLQVDLSHELVYRCFDAKERRERTKHVEN